MSDINCKGCTHGGQGHTDECTFFPKQSARDAAKKRDMNTLETLAKKFGIAIVASPVGVVPEVAKKLLDIRDALVCDNYEEAYNALYKIANPDFASTKPWDELEKLADGVFRMDKPTIPEIMPLIKEYYALPGNNVGGNLHIVLEDDNVRDCDIEFCLTKCNERLDVKGVRLCELLLRMSKTQRHKLHMLQRAE